MQIEVKLYGNLRQYRPETAGGAPHHPFLFTIPENSAVQTLVMHLGIPDGLINGAALNGEAVGLDALLHEGDKVHLFAPAAGGTVVSDQ